MQKIKYYRWAPSLGEFESSPEKVWGVKPYDPDSLEPVVFCGLYGLNDFHALWRYKGPKYIWWTGSDIRHFLDGYWLDDKGILRVPSKNLGTWISQNCESWVENDLEAEQLHWRFGITSNVCPSFLGDVNKFDVTFKPSDTPKLYTSVSGDDFKLYGWDKLWHLAHMNTNVEFHLYGNTVPFGTRANNIIDHGRVTKQQFNKETKAMQGALRLTAFDGFSELLAKSILRGQYPVSLIDYPHMLSVRDIGFLKGKKTPNIEGRNYYINKLNKYPWAK